MLEVNEVEMAPDVDEVPIIDAGTANRLLVDTKPEGADEVEHR
jgi:hypothetical protein